MCAGGFLSYKEKLHAKTAKIRIFSALFHTLLLKAKVVFQKNFKKF